MKCDPKNATAVFALTFAVVESVNELRWYRANGFRGSSLRGGIAYVKARPFRFALGVVVAWAPDVVGLISARGDRGRADHHVWL